MQQAKPETIYEELDCLWQSALARLTLGVSPASIATSVFAWSSQLGQSPGRMLELALYPAKQMQQRVEGFFVEGKPPCGDDPRFKSESWGQWPWRLYMESFLTAEDWWKQATTHVPGLDDHAERVVSFGMRQIMDALCPTNFPATNPDLVQQTIAHGGTNLLHGMINAIADTIRTVEGLPQDGDRAFHVGKNIAATPGDVIFRNELIELIQYAPQRETVYKEPVLILPAWIMKYYILDLSQDNSLVRWLVAQGHTVFMVSWKNPGPEDRNLGMDDYYRLGAMAALDAVSKAVPDTKIHMTGYCLGGTLSMIAASAMDRDGDDRLASLSLFAAQGDFTEAGELMLFVSPSEVSFLKNVMREKGYLDTRQMAGTFQMLRSYDLIWSKIVNDYLEGRRKSTFDLTAWNADATRMPYKMHSEYLEKLFLHNDFAEGRFQIDGESVAPENIQTPVFCVGTEKDHVAPWRSVYKIHLMTDGDVTFVLTVGGHNAGIVSEPGHPGRSYRIAGRKPGEPYLDPDQWQETATVKQGSWWKPWQQWLAQHSTAKKIAAPVTGKSLCPAPGTYVLQK